MMLGWSGISGELLAQKELDIIQHMTDVGHLFSATVTAMCIIN